jgi:hypothetical protein
MNLMRARRLMHLAGIAALAAMLFAQAAFALAACDAVAMRSRAQIVMQGAQSAPCHEPTENVNLCLTHCQGTEQTLDKHQVKVPELPLEAVIAVPARREPPQPIVRWAPRAPSPAVSPPPRILFRSFQI